MDMVQRPYVGQLVAPVAGARIVIEAELNRIDSSALVLDCDEERARAIIGIIRLHYRSHEQRCYVVTGKRGKRL